MVNKGGRPPKFETAEELEVMINSYFQSLVYEVASRDEYVTLDGGHLKITEIAMENLEIDPSRERAFLDYDKLKFPLKVRHWAAGDWFVPMGMKGKKKVSDLMIDEKIPLNLKSRVLVMESAGDIIWVLGHRIDDRYKITDRTTRAWRG